MRKNILIINRWNDEFSCYRKHLPSDKFDIFMIVKKGNENSVKINAPKDFRIIDEISFLKCKEGIDELIEANFSSVKQELSVDNPVFNDLLVLSEFDMIVGAQLREFFLIPGPNLRQVLSWRDKNAMKEKVLKSRIRVPHWKLPQNEKDILDFFSTHKNGIVLKPLREAASNGVFICRSEYEIQLIFPQIEVNLSTYEMEEFILFPIGHVDGVMRNGILNCGVVSLYLGDCLSFSKGEGLGSITLVEGTESKKYLNFAENCLQALDVENSIFHLEFFACEEPIFLEVGVRMGGGEIPWIMRDIFNLDLFATWLFLLTGQNFKLEEANTKNVVGGFLMIPEPVGKKLIGLNFNKDNIPELYSMDLPEIGHVFDGKGGYEKILGRFRYRGSDSEKIKIAIEKTLQEFKPILELHENNL